MLNNQLEVLAANETARLTKLSNSQSTKFRIEIKPEGQKQWSMLLLGSNEAQAMKSWDQLITTGKINRLN